MKNDDKSKTGNVVSATGAGSSASSNTVKGADNTIQAQSGGKADSNVLDSTGATAAESTMAWYKTKEFKIGVTLAILAGAVEIAVKLLAGHWIGGAD